MHMRNIDAGDVCPRMGDSTRDRWGVLRGVCAVGTNAPQQSWVGPTAKRPSHRSGCCALRHQCRASDKPAMSTCSDSPPFAGKIRRRGETAQPAFEATRSMLQVDPAEVRSWYRTGVPVRVAEATTPSLILWVPAADPHMRLPRWPDDSVVQTRATLRESDLSSSKGSTYCYAIVAGAARFRGPPDAASLRFRHSRAPRLAAGRPRDG